MLLKLQAPYSPGYQYTGRRSCPGREAADQPLVSTPKVLGMQGTCGSQCVQDRGPGRGRWAVSPAHVYTGDHKCIENYCTLRAAADELKQQTAVAGQTRQYNMCSSSWHEGEKQPTGAL
eukprot:scaffold108091_cov18-Tisochrysis_lutea.AAC.4